MLRRLAIALPLVLVAGVILVASILRSASIRYSFKLAPTPTPSAQNIEGVNYDLPYSGRVMPGSLLWPLKVTRDKLWLFVTTNPLKRAEIALLIADKRMSAGKEIFEKGNIELATSVFTKSEIYLEESLSYAIEAKKKGMDTSEFLEKLALSSLKHREVLETMSTQAPEDAKPVFNRIGDYCKKVYEQSSHALREMGKNPPPSPFYD